eukprot:ANDGO_07911.mRNA.1 Gelation factor
MITTGYVGSNCRASTECPHIDRSYCEMLAVASDGTRERSASLRPTNTQAWITMQTNTFSRRAMSVMASARSSTADGGGCEVRFDLLAKDSAAESSEIASQLYSLIYAVGVRGNAAFRLVGWHKSPKSHMQLVENLNIAMGAVNDFAKTLGANVTFSAPNVLEKDTKLNLGMLWVLIRKYGNLNDRELLEWCRTSCGLDSVTDFGKSWKDGKNFAAMIAVHDPSAREVLDEKVRVAADSIASLTTVLDFAQERYHVPKLLDPDEMRASDMVDDKSIMTYISALRDGLKKHVSGRLIEVLGDTALDRAALLANIRDFDAYRSWTSQRIFGAVDREECQEILENYMSSVVRREALEFAFKLGPAFSEVRSRIIADEDSWIMHLSVFGDGMKAAV